MSRRTRARPAAAGGSAAPRPDPLRERLTLPEGRRGALWHYRWQGRLHPRHTHAELELNLVTAGTATYLVGERAWRLDRGTLVWLFPDQDHLLVEQSADYRMWIAVLQPGLVAQACAETRPELGRSRPPPGWIRRLAEPQLRRLDRLAEEVFAAREDAPRFEAGLAWLLLVAWDAMGAGDELPPNAAVHPAVERAVQLLRQEPGPAGVPALARRCGLSPQRLSRLFKAQMGVALGDYRARRRLERALALIDAGRPLTEAALGAGFGSYVQFHRVFTRHLGQPPSRWAAELRQP